MPKTRTRPFKFTGKRPSKKKTMIKKGGMELIPGLSRPRGLYGYPQNVITKLRYCDYGAFANTTSAAGYNYRANSVFDPDQTATGHQPLYFDNFAAVYNRYRVLGSIIRVKFTPQADKTGTNIAAQGGPWIVGINGTTDTTNYATVGPTRMEVNDATWELLGARSGGTDVVEVISTYSPDKTLGKPADDDVVSAAVSASPSQQWYWQLFVVDTTGNSTVDLEFVTAIEYTVEFFEPKNQAQN